MPRLAFIPAMLLWPLLHATCVAQTAAPSFVNDVEPVLTRLGCNQGSCHGKGAGQNGFRLSLRGYAPEWDHAWITHEFKSRRINPTAPEQSLLLAKPTGRAPHEGGVLMKQGGRAYQVLLSWIQAGAPGVRKDDSALRRVEILPIGRVLRVGETQQLVAKAEFSDGQVKDVTWVTQFYANDASVAEVSADGVVKVLRPGETAVRAHFMGQVAVALVTAPHETPVHAALFTAKNNFIDAHVFRKLGDLRIEPSEPCADEHFIRRIYLDTIGVLPTPAEVRAFLADKAADRRSSWTSGRCSSPTWCRTARSVTMTCAAARACVGCTSGCASKWRGIGRGTKWSATC